LIGQQKATIPGTGKLVNKYSTMRADSPACSASLNAARRATISRRNTRRQAVLSSFGSTMVQI
jgi:hypothetical protein